MSGIKTAFLCHSHHDRQLAEGLINLLAQKGLRLYVDWADSEMPSSPNGETAAKIRGKIKELDLFLFLATANSMASRWCPWELGCADGVKAWERIVIVPTIERQGAQHGNEYMQLYRRIEPITGDDFGIYKPDNTGGIYARNL